MTITYVAAGAVAAGNNASLVPALPAGLADGDFMVLLAVIRNAGSGGSVNTPSGWAFIAGGSGFEAEGRFYQAGDTAPTVTFGGGVANADTQAVILAFRGVSRDFFDAQVKATQTNGSAQNIAYPALDLPGGGFAVVLAGWKQDDSSAVSTPAGFTSVAYSSVTTGDDASLAVRYQIQTVEADVSGSSLTVTGGVSAISRAILIGIKPAAAIAVQTQDSYPPRTLVSVTGLTVGDDVSVYRQVAGERTLLRAGSVADIGDPSFLVVDAELPFGVAVSYVAVVNSVAEYATGATTYTLPGGKVALSDAVGGVAAEVVILSWPEKAFEAGATVYRIASGRNVVVSGALGQFSSTLEVFCETTSSVDTLRELLASATSSTVQIRQLGGYDGVDCYVTVTGYRERRWSQDGTDQRRIFALEVAEVSGWAPTLEAQGFTLQDIADFYGAGGTLADIDADFTSLLQIAQADFTP